MPGIAPVLGLSQAKRVRLVDWLALAADHVLYGLVLSEMRCRPHGWPRLAARPSRQSTTTSRASPDPAR